MANILDFTERGEGVIEIPHFLSSNETGTISVEVPEFQYSALIFFKNPFTQLLEIEQDILMADTSERRQFLLKYKSLLEKYTDNNADFGIDYWGCYKRKNTVSVLFKPLDIRLSVSNYQLRHTLAWYMQSLLDDEINQLNYESEMLKGLVRFCEEGLLDKVISLIRSSSSPKEALQKIVEKFEFTENQSMYLLRMKLRNLMNLQGLREKERLGRYEEFASFLEELKS